MKHPRAAATGPTEALFVRIPAEHARRLDRAAFELRRPKQALVSELLARYIDPDSPASLAALAGAPSGGGAVPRATAPAPRPRAEGGRRRVTVETLEPDTLLVGHHSFRPQEPERAIAVAPEVLRGEQAAELLQLTAAVVERLAEQGELPGRRLAGEWRFSRAALLAWLAQPAPPPAGGADERGR